MVRGAQVCFVLQEADLVLLARVSGGERSGASVALDAAVALPCVVRCAVCCTAHACLHRQAWRLRAGAMLWARRRCRLQTSAHRAVCMLPLCCKPECERCRSMLGQK